MGRWRHAIGVRRLPALRDLCLHRLLHSPEGGIVSFSEDGRESVGRDTEACMMVEAAPAAALIVTEADLLLEFEVVAFGPPAQLGLIDHAFEWDVGRQRGEPVIIGVRSHPPAIR